MQVMIAGTRSFSNQLFQRCGLANLLPLVHSGRRAALTADLRWNWDVTRVLDFVMYIPYMKTMNDLVV